MWIIDIEASGLGNASYPIEIGITNGAENYSSLIKPLSSWVDWDLNSAKIHGICRETLVREGKEAFVVAEEVSALLNNQPVYCSNIGYDDFWLEILFKQTNVLQKFVVKNIYDLFEDKPGSLDEFNSKKEKLVGSSEFLNHRALDDARVIWLALSQNRLG